MNNQERDPQDLCAESYPDDGVPPHVLAKRGRPSRSSKAGRHRLDQLCKQVSIALGEALICECDDPALHDLEIVSVTPVTGSTVLQVVCRLRESDPDVLTDTYERLTAASGVLRAAVASAIHRKRVPQLRFCVVGE